MKPLDITIIGGDMRQVYMIEFLLKKGYSIGSFGLKQSLLNNQCFSSSSLEELIACSQVIIAPIPFTKDQKNIYTMESQETLEISRLLSLLKPCHTLFSGAIPKSISQHCKTEKIPYIDLMEIESVAILNAIATAEGTIMEAINAAPTNLYNSNCLILGYGRCGKVLADRLKGFHTQVTIAARSKIALASATSLGYNTIQLSKLSTFIFDYDYIFNTIPSLIISEALLSKTKSDVIIIDIASAPGGVDFDAAKDLNRTTKLCLGIPGKVSPKTSAEILCRNIIDII
jgi:dipicolinate synthase subunit A